MTNTMNDTMTMTNACGDVSLSIVAHLREMRRPSISLEQIANAFDDYCDDANITLSDEMLAYYSGMIALHPAIRTAIRP